MKLTPNRAVVIALLMLLTVGAACPIGSTLVEKVDNPAMVPAVELTAVVAEKEALAARSTAEAAKSSRQIPESATPISSSPAPRPQVAVPYRLGRQLIASQLGENNVPLEERYEFSQDEIPYFVTEVHEVQAGVSFHSNWERWNEELGQFVLWGTSSTVKTTRVHKDTWLEYHPHPKDPRMQLQPGKYRVQLVVDGELYGSAIEFTVQ